MSALVHLSLSENFPHALASATRGTRAQEMCQQLEHVREVALEFVVVAAIVAVVTVVVFVRLWDVGDNLGIDLLDVVVAFVDVVFVAVGNSVGEIPVLVVVAVEVVAVLVHVRVAAVEVVDVFVIVVAVVVNMCVVLDMIEVDDLDAVAVAQFSLKCLEKLHLREQMGSGLLAHVWQKLQCCLHLCLCDC